MKILDQNNNNNQRKESDKRIDRFVQRSFNGHKINAFFYLPISYKPSLSLMLGRPPSLWRAALESSESNLWLMTETFFFCFGDPLLLRTKIRIN